MDAKDLKAELVRLRDLLADAAEIANEREPDIAAPRKQRAQLIDKLTSARIRVEVLLKKLGAARER